MNVVARSATPPATRPRAVSRPLLGAALTDAGPTTPIASHRTTDKDNS